jgi:hypothetical protein
MLRTKFFNGQAHNPRNSFWLNLAAALWFMAAFFPAPAFGEEPAYEARAQAVAAGLIRLNGLRHWPADDPAAWPPLPADLSRLRRESGRPVLGAAFSPGQPARLTALALVNAGLERVADLSGLTALTALDLSGNRLRGLNLAGDEALVSLAVMRNQLSSLDLASSPILTALDLSNNELVRLDLAANPLLDEVNLSRNRLKDLDLQNNRELTRLEVTGNQLAGLDISANPGLNLLRASYNRLRALDLAANPVLTWLDLRNNALDVLDLSRNPDLRELVVGRNRLTRLDLSHNPGLTRLEAEHNRLTSLDLGHCGRLEILEAPGNPLTEIKVSPEAPLVSLNLDGGRLPLSSLAPLTGRARDRTRFGRQSRVLFETLVLALREELDLSAEAEFGGVPTEFQVLDEKSRRLKPAYYTLEGGRLRFNVPGRYLVEMSNPQVFSSERGGGSGAARLRRVKVKAVTGLVEVRP